MTWLRRITKGIVTRTAEKKETPDGLWHQCPACKKRLVAKKLLETAYVCEKCNYHLRINSEQYFEVLFDDNTFTELYADLASKDILEFTDIKSYTKRLEQSKKKSGLTDAIRVASGPLTGDKITIACMDFKFIGGSMGSVVGEKIALAIDYSLKHKQPLLIISKSGGARMMEAGYSLMQMAKTSSRLTLLAKAKIPYFSLMTDPTTGGVTASFAMLGDINLAEPGALIGFAGPRVIKETIRKELPKDFQKAETLLECGFLDKIVDRRAMKQTLSDLIGIMRVA